MIPSPTALAATGQNCPSCLRMLVCFSQSEEYNWIGRMEGDVFVPCKEEGFASENSHCASIVFSDGTSAIPTLGDDMADKVEV